MARVVKGESKKERRHKKIQAILLDRGMARIQELCELLGCSEATLRNDLREMEGKGLIKRTFGGAISTGNLVGPNFVHQKLHQVEKEAIARYVIQNIVKEGNTIILDVGTTTMAVAQVLAQTNLKVNVVTNSLITANFLIKNKNVDIHVPGGKYDRFLDTFDFSDSISYYNNIHADYFLMSCNGVTLESGFTVPQKVLAVTKSIIMKHVNKSIMLVDHTKIGKTAFYKACDFSDIDLLVVDEKCSESDKQLLEGTGVDVRYAMEP